jgi:hypothetical protein
MLLGDLPKIHGTRGDNRYTTVCMRVRVNTTVRNTEDTKPEKEEQGLGARTA